MLTNINDINPYYLTDLPNDKEFKKRGLCKTLLVRKEMIHLKHILTAIFVRKTINVVDTLELINKDLFWFMEYFTNKIRKLFKINRAYVEDFNKIINQDYNHFFPYVDSLSGLKNVIVLDFDGVITKNSFLVLYMRLVENYKVIVCSANPTISEEWFTKKELPLPYKIYANKGKIKKIMKLIEINQKYDFVFYIDDEQEYLERVWIFGIKTYLYSGNKIKYFTLKQ